MKGLLGRTKVVLRHLPPTISQSALTEHIDSRFSGRYRWLSFRPGKASQKHITYSRGWIDFNKPEDVVEFAEFFNGHVFVNEKGTQYKMIVEYAPSQRVPKHLSKNDGREGTILKDPEYLEFLEFLAKPIDNLPSAEVQLERKEAERLGAPKDIPIVTPLMDYVRQKRAARGGVRRNILNGKPRRVNGILSRVSASSSSKSGSNKKTSAMYMLRDSSKGLSSNDKSSYLVVSKHDEQHSDKSVNSTAVSRTDALEVESGGSGPSDLGKQKILLLKGKEKDIFNVYGGSSIQQNAASSANNARIPASLKQNQRRELSGKTMRSILVNRDNHQSQTLFGSHSEQRFPESNQDRDKKPPRPPNLKSFPKNSSGAPEAKGVGHDLQTVHTEKQEKRTRNKDRPDRGVWAPLQRSDGSHASDESLSSATSQTSQVTDSAEDLKQDVLIARGGEYRPIGSGRGSHYIVGNGSFRHGGRRGSAYNAKDADGSHQEGKFSKRGGSSSHGSHDKQVWVQKSSLGS